MGRGKATPCGAPPLARRRCRARPVQRSCELLLSLLLEAKHLLLRVVVLLLLLRELEPLLLLPLLLLKRRENGRLSLRPRAGHSAAAAAAVHFLWGNGLEHSGRGHGRRAPWQ